MSLHTNDLQRLFRDRQPLSVCHFDIVRRIGHRGTASNVSEEAPKVDEVHDYFGCESMVFAAYLKGFHHLGSFALKVKLTFRAQERAIRSNLAKWEALTSHKNSMNNGPDVTSKKKAVLKERHQLIPELNAASDYFFSLFPAENPAAAAPRPLSCAHQSTVIASMSHHLCRKKHDEHRESVPTDGCAYVLPVLSFFIDELSNFPASVVDIVDQWRAYGNGLAPSTVVLVYPHIQFFNLRQVCVPLWPVVSVHHLVNVIPFTFKETTP